jgi:hypothetical protein
MEELILKTKINLLNEILEMLNKYTDDNTFKFKLWDMYFKLNDKLEYTNYLKYKYEEKYNRHRCDHL